MKSRLTSLALPEDLSETLHTLAEQRGESKTSLIQQAIRQFLLREQLLKLECKLQAQARKMGLASDEDVVEMLHQFRKDVVSNSKQ